jgi:ATP-dependent DNA ligase
VLDLVQPLLATGRLRVIVEALAKLRSRSCIIDDEAVVCADDGIASFNRIRYRRHDASVFLYAFDLIKLNGDDLRRDPLAVRKATLASLLARATSQVVGTSPELLETPALLNKTTSRSRAKPSVTAGSQ